MLQLPVSDRVRLGSLLGAGPIAVCLEASGPSTCMKGHFQNREVSPGESSKSKKNFPS